AVFLAPASLTLVPTCCVANWRQFESSIWNWPKSLPLPGSTITLGPDGTEAHAPASTLTRRQRAIGFFMASILAWRNLDPRLRARLNAGVVPPRARAVVPGGLRGRLRRRLGRRLDRHRLRR